MTSLQNAATDKFLTELYATHDERFAEICERADLFRPNAKYCVFLTCYQKRAWFFDVCEHHASQRHLRKKLAKGRKNGVISESEEQASITALRDVESDGASLRNIHDHERLVADLARIAFVDASPDSRCSVIAGKRGSGKSSRMKHWLLERGCRDVIVVSKDEIMWKDAWNSLTIIDPSSPTAAREMEVCYLALRAQSLFVPKSKPRLIALVFESDCAAFWKRYARKMEPLFACYTMLPELLRGIICIYPSDVPRNLRVYCGQQ